MWQLRFRFVPLLPSCKTLCLHLYFFAIQSYSVMADLAIAAMPPNSGVTSFVVIADTSSPPPPSPSFLVAALKGLVKGYPDRLHKLIAAPSGGVMKTVVNIATPLLPSRLADKLTVLSTVEEARLELEGLLQNGLDDVPTFFGGEADHEEFYPKDIGVTADIGESGSATGTGSGTGSRKNVLNFDIDKMMDRMKERCPE